MTMTMTGIVIDSAYVCDNHSLEVISQLAGDRVTFRNDSCINTEGMQPKHDVGSRKYSAKTANMRKTVI